MAQYQTTIFGTEEKCEAGPPVCDKARFIELTVRLSEDTSRPVYIPKNGHGTWYMSIDGKAYAKAYGTRMGLTTDWEVFDCHSSFAGLMVREAFSQMIGTCLMNGSAIEIKAITFNSITFALFGVTGNTFGNSTVYRDGDKWVKEAPSDNAH